MELGEYNVLRIARLTDFGYFLEQEDGQEVLLPNKYCTDEMEIDQEISVFIYRDSEDRIVATTLDPFIQAETFAYLKVVAVNQFGAFLDWGLEKDLMVPFKEQANRMVEGNWYVVFMYVDEDSDRLVATSKTKRFLNEIDVDVNRGDEVEILVCGYSDLGMNVIVNNSFPGLIYEDEIFESVSPGDIRKAYVKKVREDDKLDISLQPLGVASIEPNAQKLLKKLQEEEGFLPINDKTDPDTISFRLGMSKKTFKKALGNLYKQRLVTIDENGTYLTDDGKAV